MTCVLVAAAHPDDEALGCGGTIARHVDAGDDVHVLFFTDGVGSRSAGGQPEATAVEVRSKAAQLACNALGCNPPQAFDFPDNAMDQVSILDLAKVLDPVITRLQPRIIYTHHGGDLNVDHQQICRAVMTVCRPQPGCPVKEIYNFEVPSSTGWGSRLQDRAFDPETFIDIKATFDRKMDALKAYEKEMRPWPHARSMEGVEALARWRGAQQGLEMAEAFMCSRRIIS